MDASKTAGRDLVTHITYREQEYELFEPMKSKWVKKYECPVCLEIFNRPVKVCDGQHIFCKACAENVAKRCNAKCPVCQGALKKDIHLAEIELSTIRMFEDELEVKCPMGCPDPIGLGGISEHQQKYCSHKIVICPATGCGKKIPVTKLEEHQTSECPARPVTCRQCKQLHPKNGRLSHVAEECREYPKDLKDKESSDREMDEPTAEQVIRYLRKKLRMITNTYSAPSTPRASIQEELPEGLDSLFNPGLSDRELFQQLEILKAHDATVAGIPLACLNHIKTVDLRKSKGPFRHEADCLTLLSGDFVDGKQWLYLQGGTYIGSFSPIMLRGGKVVFPDIPKTYVSSDFSRIKGWEEILPEERKGERALHSSNYELGRVPTILLKHGNLVGVHIDAKNGGQGIVAAYGNPVIAHCTVFNSLNYGITLCDVDSHRCEQNTVHTTKNNLVGVVVRTEKALTAAAKLKHLEIQPPR